MEEVQAQKYDHKHVQFWNEQRKLLRSSEFDRFNPFFIHQQTSCFSPERWYSLVALRCRMNSKRSGIAFVNVTSRIIWEEPNERSDVRAATATTTFTKNNKIPAATLIEVHSSSWISSEKALLNHRLNVINPSSGFRWKVLLGRKPTRK